MSSLLIKWIAMLLEILEHIALRTDDTRLLDQVIFIREALRDVGWKR